MSLLGRRIGNYEIKAKIGEGGMGTVYLGEHPLIGKRVAVKVLLEELSAKQDVVSRFFHEARAVNGIGHVNIVDIVDFGKEKGERGDEIVYFIMEFLDGEALSARIRRQGLPFRDTVHIVQQCCSALAASHAKKIVHRDLKPENIYLIRRGADANFVKLLDFGIAKLTGDNSSSHKTRTGLVIGTPSYMSPEQCEGKGQVDHRSDVYSLGVVMYELLTGSLPFPGDAFGEILVAHLTRPPPEPSTVNPQVPPALEAIVLHALEKDRNRRFQTMNEMLDALTDPEAHLAAWKPIQPSSEMQTVASLPLRKFPIEEPGPGAPTTLSGGRRPTTLEGAAAEVGFPPRRPGGRAAVIAATSTVLALASVGGYFAFGNRAEKKMVAPVASTAAATPRPGKTVSTVDDTVVVTVTSEPRGAKVQRTDDRQAEIAETPVNYTLPRSSRQFEVQLRLDGYLAQTRTIVPSASQTVLVTLAKQPFEPPAAKSATESKAAAGLKNATSAKGSAAANAAAKKGTSKHGGSAKGNKSSAPGKEDDDMNIIQPSF